MREIPLGRFTYEMSSVSLYGLSGRDTSASSRGYLEYIGAGTAVRGCRNYLLIDWSCGERPNCT